MIIVDFDYTLYRTDLLVRDMKEVLRAYGVGEEDFASSYNKSLQWDGAGYGFAYSFVKHIDILHHLGFVIPAEAAVKKLQTCVKKEYLFPDAIPFLQFLKSLGERVILLTAGDQNFQAMKIAATDIAQDVDEAVYRPGNKENFIREVLATGEQVVFINDNSKENAIIKKKFPDVKVIGKINSFKYDKEDLAENDIPYFSSLSEIKDYIIQQKYKTLNPKP